MKNQVIKFFQELPQKVTEQFNQALDLYRKSDYANPSMVRHLNMAGYSPSLLDNLLYDLKKLHGITDAMVRSAKVMQLEADNPFKLMVVPQFEKGNAGMKQRRDYIKEHNISASGKKKVDLDNAIENHIANLNDDIIAEKEKAEAEANKEVTPESDDEVIVITAKEANEVFPSAPAEVKEVIKLREQYQFLSADDCPDELKILVADKQTAYEKYVVAHIDLLVVIPEEGKEAVAMTNEQIFELAKIAVENFTINQDIFAEMEHYNETGEILGEHPIFIKRKLQDGINAMSMADAAKRQTNLEGYVRRDGNALKAATKDKDKIKLEKKIKNWKAELELINAKLGAK